MEISGGSDFRAYEILRLMKSKNVSINKILLFDFLERVQAIDKNEVQGAVQDHFSYGPVFPLQGRKAHRVFKCDKAFLAFS
jgi:hypothetical protein